MPQDGPTAEHSRLALLAELPYTASIGEDEDIAGFMLLTSPQNYVALSSRELWLPIVPGEQIEAIRSERCRMLSAEVEERSRPDRADRFR